MKYIIIPIFIVIFLFVSCLSADAAKQEFKFERINFGYRKVTSEETTIMGLDKSKLTGLGKPQEWGIIEAIYGSKPDWADDVELRYYVLLKTRQGNDQVMLTGSLTYINVEKGKSCFSYIYMPPQVLRRYGKVLYIRAEIWYNGILQDAMQWPKQSSKAQWWMRVKPISGSLMNRFYTPFEHEAQLKEELIKVQ